MPAGKLNLRIEQGAAYRKRLVWKDKNKRPVAMTGFTALMQVRDKPGGEILLELSTQNGGIVLSSGGVVEIVLTSAQTDALTFESGAYDLKIIAGPGNDIRLIEGRVTVSPAITRARA